MSLLHLEKRVLPRGNSTAIPYAVFAVLSWAVVTPNGCMATVTPNSVSAVISAAGAFDDNAFFVESFGPFYPASATAELAARWNIGGGMVVEGLAFGDALRDLGSREWNRLDWNNAVVYGLGLGLLWDPRSQRVLASPSVRDIGVRVSLRSYRVDFYSDALGAAETRARSDVTAGIASWLSLRSSRQTDELPGLRLSFRGAPAADLGLGFRYSRTNLFFTGLDGFYILQGDARAELCILRERFHRFSLGPAGWVSFQRDLGRQTWNRSDWLNHYDSGLAFAFGSTLVESNAAGWQRGLSFAATAGVQWRWYADRGLFVPAFRPTTDWMIRASARLTFGLALNAGGAR